MDAILRCLRMNKRRSDTAQQEKGGQEKDKEGREENEGGKAWRVEEKVREEGRED